MPIERDHILASPRLEIRRPERPLVRVSGEPGDRVRANLPAPVAVLRTSDLLHIHFSYSNLLVATVKGRRVLRRRVTNRPAFLIADFPPQHMIERAFYQDWTEGSPSFPKPYRTDGTDATADAKPPAPELGPSQAVHLPVDVRLSTHTRLVFKVLTEEIPFTLAGLLTACSTLPLNVAAHALPSGWGSISLTEVLADHQLNVGRRIARARSLDVSVAQIAAVSRSLAVVHAMEHRLGTTDALSAVSELTVTRHLGVSRIINKAVGSRVRLPIRPVPRPPTSTETQIELPWRLKVSPSVHGGFAHAIDPVDHRGRVELWHSRLGTRIVGGEQISVDENDSSGRNIRAIWTRDSDQFGFKDKPTLPGDFPNADGSDDVPDFRKSLNSRDRMMLVHETSNFTLRRNGARWTPPVVEVDNLMLTTLGGWLRSDLDVPELPDGAVTISEWKHRATLGRDHQVKVVYAGFLFPFGHRASLVKITERKFRPDLPGNPAVLFQRFFIICREQTRHYSRHDTIDDQRTYGPTKGPKQLDLVMPLSSVSILTRVTPDLDLPAQRMSGGLVFFPYVDGAPFLFKILATDREANIVEYSGPLMFVERDHNLQTANAQALRGVIQSYWNGADIERRHPLGGQRVAFAPSVAPGGAALDTTLNTDALYWDGLVLPAAPSIPQDEPRFAPILRTAKVVVPAMSALAGANNPIEVSYPAHFAAQGLAANAANVFLAVANTPQLSFAQQGDRSGGFVTPNLAVTALSGSSGPIGGDLTKAVAGTTTPADFFSGITAKLFGVVSLPELLKAVGLPPAKFPSFVGQALDRVTAFMTDLQRIVALANDAQSRFAAQADTQVQAALAALNGIKADAQAVVTAIGAFDPSVDITPTISAVAAKLANLGAAVDAAKQLPAAVRNEGVGLARRLAEHVENVAELVGLIEQFAKGISLPPVITARLHWSTQLAPWPASASVFQPIPKAGQSNAQARSTLDLSVEVQAPTKPGKQPTALVSCSISPFRLQLIGDDPFIALQMDKIEFLLAPGRKPDVNVVFAPGDNGIVFGGPLSFVNTLRDIIPFDGFSDPPYLDVTKDGIKAGFDLAVPNLAVGLFTLANISLGAQVRVPFIDDSLDFTFNFCTRENPFRLTVWLFGGGGFFAITVTPEKCRVLEAAFEFGAAVALDFGVASGSIEVMAGIYFRLEDDNSQLTGYFRMRGEVDVLGLISASIELYLELTYEFPSGKAVGRASLTIEVEIFFLSFSVSISVEKKFKGSNEDPSFVEIMGPPDANGVRPWDEYCKAFEAA